MTDLNSKEFNKFDSNGSVKTITGISIPEYDYVSAAYPNATTEVYTYKSGGSSGTTVATLTVIYTDSSKDNLSSVERS
jgi:hypothetical protein